MKLFRHILVTVLDFLNLFGLKVIARSAEGFGGNTLNVSS